MSAREIIRWFAAIDDGGDAELAALEARISKAIAAERERIVQLMRERIAWLESAKVTPAASVHVRCNELEQMIRRIEA